MEYEEFLKKLSNPARRALEYEGILSVESLSKLSEKELLSIHGIGPKSLPIVFAYLEGEGLKLKG